MMAPASGFYSTTGAGKNQVRIAYVLNIQDLTAAIKCLEEGLKEFVKSAKAPKLVNA
jgi:aspartate aminotransferase